jgi:6-phosphofructokinase 1
MMNRIAVLTSGGDVPGLNAALHAIVLIAFKKNVTVIGVHDGYDGLIDGRFFEMDVQLVRNIVDRGGTILRTCRSNRFLEHEFRKKAFEQLKRDDIEGLIIIGGNGSLTGAEFFAREFNFPVIGIPKTIDNDVSGTDYSIGFDTASNTIVEAVDKIKDTADSTSRVFIVEVMGRHAGFLALRSGISVAASAIIIPEIKPDIQKLLSFVEYNWRIGNHSMIIIITEHSIPDGGMGLKKIFDSRYPEFDSRLTILGHVQRGGSPSAFDRTLASTLAYHATNALLNGSKGEMAAFMNNKFKFIPLSEVANKTNQVDNELMKVAGGLSILI